MDATPALVDVDVVEQGALDGDPPGVRCLHVRLLAVSSTYLGLLPPSWLWDILLFCFVLVAATPHPVLGSFHPHSTHFRPSVHQHFSLEIRDLYSFHQLAIQRLVVAFHHLHWIVDILTALVVIVLSEKVLEHFYMIMINQTFKRFIVFFYLKLPLKKTCLSVQSR